MHLAKLRSLLDSGGIVPNNVRQLEAFCKEWFLTEPSLVSFVYRSIFRELREEWDDPQAIPTAVYKPFEEQFLPELKKSLDRLSSKEQPELVLNSSPRRFSGLPQGCDCSWHAVPSNRLSSGLGKTGIRVDAPYLNFSCPGCRPCRC